MSHNDGEVPMIQWGSAERAAAKSLIELALAEDLGVGLAAEASSLPDLADLFSVTTIDTILDNVPDPLPSDLDRDLTCAALVEPHQSATIDVVVRRSGILAGGPVAELVFATLDPSVQWQSAIADGSVVESGAVIARVTGPLRSLLIGERTSLNFLMHLSGIATQTGQFVAAISGTKSVILDTRKTLPGWRLLEKYAVRCGGGTNHRLGLHDGVLIKDNHLAAWGNGSIADAVRQARRCSPAGVSIEVEVDSLKQLSDALSGEPDIVLLDNMNPMQIREAIQLRNASSLTIHLEASGGITLSNVREIAETGVDRISIGALTHSAPALDIAFDWPK